MAKEDGERGGGFGNFLIYEGLGKKEDGGAGIFEGRLILQYIYIYNQSVQELWVRGTS